MSTVSAFRGLEQDEREENKATILELATISGEIFHGLAASYDANSRWLRFDAYESLQYEKPSMIVAVPEHAIARLAIIHIDLDPGEDVPESRPRIGFEFVPKRTDE